MSMTNRFGRYKGMLKNRGAEQTAASVDTNHATLTGIPGGPFAVFAEIMSKETVTVPMEWELQVTDSGDVDQAGESVSFTVPNGGGEFDFPCIIVPDQGKVHIFNREALSAGVKTRVTLSLFRLG